MNVKLRSARSLLCLALGPFLLLVIGGCQNAAPTSKDSVPFNKGPGPHNINTVIIDFSDAAAKRFIRSTGKAPDLIIYLPANEDAYPKDLLGRYKACQDAVEEDADADIEGPGPHNNIEGPGPHNNIQGPGPHNDNHRPDPHRGIRGPGSHRGVHGPGPHNITVLVTLGSDSSSDNAPGKPLSHEPKVWLHFGTSASTVSGADKASSVPFVVINLPEHFRTGTNGVPAEHYVHPRHQ